MKALLDEYQKQEADLSDPTKKYPEPVLQDKQKAFKALQEESRRSGKMPTRTSRKNRMN